MLESLFVTVSARCSLVSVRSRDPHDGAVPIVSRFFQRCCTALQSLWHFVSPLHRIDCFRPDLHCPLSPVCTLSMLWKADINYVTILGQKLWHATLSVFDEVIAAIVLYTDREIITRDRHFGSIPGVKVVSYLNRVTTLLLVHSFFGRYYPRFNPPIPGFPRENPSLSSQVLREITLQAYRCIAVR